MQTRRRRIRSSELVQYVPYTLAKSSEGLGWRGMRAEVVRGHEPGEITLPPLDHHLLNLIVSTPTLHEHRWAGERREEIGREGAASLVPAGCESYWRWSYLTPGTACDFHVHLKPSQVQRIAMEDEGRSQELRGALCFRDPVVQQLGLLLMQEVEGGGRNGALYAESLMTALVLALFRAQRLSGAVDGTPRRYGLSSLDARRLCEYIEEHLGDELHLEEMATLANLGPGSFVRAFRATLGRTPHQYLVGRRIERAKELLLATTLPMGELALRLGFADHGHFSSTFRRKVGVAPSIFRAASRR